MVHWFTIYTSSAFDCLWCTKIKDLLRVYGVEWYEKDIHINDEYNREFKENGFRTIPQVFDEGTLIGGYEKTRDYLRLRHSERARDEELAERLTKI